jgi:hypothetical protein
MLRWIAKEGTMAVESSMKVGAAAAVVFVLLAAAGCNREPTPQGETVVAAPGASVRTGGALPHLRGIPDYPRADTGGSLQMSGGADGGQGAMFGFRTPDAPAQVINFYADAALRAGFAISQQTSAGPVAMLSAGSDAGEGFHVTATRTGAFTQVQIIAGAGRP